MCCCEDSTILRFVKPAACTRRSFLMSYRSLFITSLASDVTCFDDVSKRQPRKERRNVTSTRPEPVRCHLPLEHLYEAYVRGKLYDEYASPREIKSSRTAAGPELTLKLMRSIDRLPKSTDADLDSNVRRMLDRHITLSGLMLTDAQLVEILAHAGEELEPLPPSEHLQRHGSRPLEIHLDLDAVLRVERRSRYLDKNGQTLFVCAQHGGRALALVPDNKAVRYEVGPLTEAHVLSILLGTWRFGIARRHFAREVICDRYESQITEAQNRVKRRLEEAVAIKSDASEIYLAEHVVVYDGTQHAPRATLYEGKAFKRAKLVVPSNREFPHKTVRRSSTEALTAAGITPRVVELLGTTKAGAIVTYKDCSAVFCRQAHGDIDLPAEGTRLL